MCKAIEDMRNESLQEGMRAGIKEGIKKGIKKGMEKGMEKGAKKSMEDTVLRMLQAKKYALEEVAIMSGLSLDNVKKLNADNAV